MSSEYRWRIRMGGAAAVLAAVALSVPLFAEPASAAGGTFTTFNAPLTGTSDFLTGINHCGIGPVGIRVETTRVFAVDYCSGTLYRFPASGGAATDAGVASAVNGLNGGLTKLAGVYYGVIQTGPKAGVWTIDPDTLALGTKICDQPAGSGELRDVLANPTTSDLWVSAGNGIYRLRTTDRAPTLHLVAGGDFDGIGISHDGTTIYVAKLDQTIHGYRADTGAETMFVGIPGGHGIDGIATAGADLYVNSNDGTIERIAGDTHAVSVVASGGTRGDFVTVGPDGSLYATQSDRVEKLTPSIFDTAPGTGGTQSGPSASAGPAHPAASPSSTAVLARTGFPTMSAVAVGIALVIVGLGLYVVAGIRRT